MSKFSSMVYPAAMVLLMVLAWRNVSAAPGAEDRKYSDFIDRARMSEQKHAYITAAEYYAKAAEIKPDDEGAFILAAENYLKCEENEMFLLCCRKAADVPDCTDRPWVLMGRFYLDNDNAENAARLLSGMPERCVSDETEALLADAGSRFHLGYKSFSDVKPFSGEYFAASDGKHWGLADEEGQFCISPEYDDIGAYDPDEDIVPVCRDGVWSFVNLNGQVKFVPSEKYTFLGSYSDGLAPFCQDGKYGYTDLDYNESDKRFDRAGAFAEGVAAVCEGGKWALVDDDLEKITGCDFDEIVLDEYGFCVHNGIIHAVKGGKEVCLDTKGRECTENDSFSCGLKPAGAEGRKGYQNKKGDMAIAPFFDDVTAFTENGISLVKEDDMWKVMSLDIYR